MAEGDGIEAPAPPPGATPAPPDGGGGDRGPAPPAPVLIGGNDTPESYSYLTTGVITGMCTVFEEESKGQSNRELHADFLSMFEAAPTLTLGVEIGSAIKRRNATDAQVELALQVIVQVPFCAGRPVLERVLARADTAE